MKRREFLKLAAVTTVFPFDNYKDFGYIPNVSDKSLLTFHEQFPKAPSGKGEVVLLHPYLEKLLKVPTLPAHKQTGPDCTSQATGMACDVVQAIQVWLRKQWWNGKIATEWIHHGGRITISKQYNTNGGVAIGDACKYIKDYGVLFRRKYEKKDFSKYNFKNSNLGNVKDYPQLLKEAKRHTMGKLTRVEGWKDARAALRNLAPVIFGSKTGFNIRTRDKDGFSTPKDKWHHAWMLLGFDDRYDRPGVLMMNSFGDNFYKGPRRHNQPRGSIWVDAAVFDGIMIEAYAISDYVGANLRLY